MYSVNTEAEVAEEEGRSRKDDQVKGKKVQVSKIRGARNERKLVYEKNGAV